MDILKSKQSLLERFSAIGVNKPYWFEGMVTDTGLGYFKLRKLCLEMQDEGWLNVTKQEASLTTNGYVFFHAGGYEGLPLQNLSKRDANKSVTITPAVKEKQQNAIVSFMVKFWWVAVIPFLVGLLLLAIDKDWIKF